MPRRFAERRRLAASLPGGIVCAWLLALCVGPAVLDAGAQLRLRTESDRSALRAWFLLLIDAQFYRPTDDVTDCAGLVRHALREALRPHSPEWLRRMRLPVPQIPAEVRHRPEARGAAMPLFLVQSHPARYAEFADAKTIVGLNAQAVGRDVEGLRPGDLLYFVQPGQQLPDHLMVYVGPSAATPEAQDWVVYHTGPLDEGPGEVRKVRLEDLRRHPAPRWRPSRGNPAFVGVFRLRFFS